MTGMIDLPKEKIDANIQELQSCREQLQQISSSIITDISNLREFWVGSAASAYLDCASKMNDAVITPMINLLNAYADAINKGANNLLINDAETAKSTSAQFGGITNISSVI